MQKLVGCKGAVIDHPFVVQVLAKIVDWRSVDGFVDGVVVEAKSLIEPLCQQFMQLPFFSQEQ